MKVAIVAFETPGPACHSEPFAVILSEAKDFALAAQGKLREESRSVCFQCSRSRPLADGHPETMKMREAPWSAAA